MNLPTAKEINPYNSLDGQCAQQNFLGKSLEDAEALFREAWLKTRVIPLLFRPAFDG